MPEIRLDPRTGIFWQEVSVRGSMVTIIDGSEGATPREVSYGTWLCWDRLPQLVGDNGGSGVDHTRATPTGDKQKPGEGTA